MHRFTCTALRAADNRTDAGSADASPSKSTSMNFDGQAHSLIKAGDSGQSRSAALTRDRSTSNDKAPTSTCSTRMMPSTIIDAELGQYEVLADFKLGFAPIRMLKLRSKVTGLRVVVADYKALNVFLFLVLACASAPIVSAFCGNSGDTAAGIDPQSYVQMQLNAYAVLATETFDDSGLPHTLEHLTFMGSESYPYKGVLDLLAGRAGADGLSAWTAIDHTAYTISSAGSEGFLNMLPVYLEHILYPTLTKEAFLSEIYHVDENGEEGGVVFSEMQGIEQKSDRILSRHADRMAHPSGSGYGSVTGGLLEDLRQLDVERIRRYHDQYYKPWNLCLHVDGSVPLPQLLEVLNNVVDPMIMAKSGGLTNARPPPEWQRPFVDTISATGPIIDADFKTIVPFMADDESLGEAILKWKGPETGQRMLKTALNVLTTYLNHSEVAPLSKQLMEIKEPACISIEFSIEDYATKCMINCFIKGVPQSPEQGTASRLYHIDAEVKAVFIDVTQRGLDLKRMKAVIMKQSRMLLKKAEDDVTELLIPETIDVIIGKPSASLTKQVEEDGKQWLLALNSRLGKQGLQERADALAAAEKANHREIPSDMLTNFPLSDAGKIAWVPVESGLNSSFPGPEQTAGRIQAYLDADITELPYFVHFSHVESNFITVRVMLDTSRIPEDCRP
ncbi:hypothetical protein QFC19_001404 [Naganishia cerealis]|uniref:Uncharacterized protein n=1 Tax=Naganishia cerealis TaxID=610337 RepID=A0ACC2WI78_9TREE|nr:hypothetical protein QFC19_001404 [Naganishia cerealis]